MTIMFIQQQKGRDVEDFLREFIYFANPFRFVPTSDEGVRQWEKS